VAVVKNLMTRAGFDASGMRKGVKQANQELSNFKSNVSRTMKGIAAAIATIGVGLAIKNAAKEAMGFEASMQQIQRTMGGSASAFNTWAKNNAASFGMARSEAAKYGAVFSNLISGFSSGTAQTSQYTQDLLKASAIVASGTGRTIEDTMDRIRSGMLGSTEAIEDLGINVNIAMIESTDAFKKFANGKSWAKLSFQTQQQIRLFAILEQASKKYGTEIADNTSSQQQKFIAQLKNAQLALGQAFLPIYNVVLPALTRLATSLANVMNVVAQFSQALFGKPKEQAKAVSNQATAVEGLGDAYTAAGKAAKGSVAGFDEVNNISDSAGGAGSGSTPMATGGTTMADEIGPETESVSEKVKRMAENVKQAFKDMKDSINENKDLILASLAALGAGFATFWAIANGGAAFAAIKAAFAGIAAAIGAVSLPVLLIAAAVAALVGAFVYFYRTNETFRDTVHTILQKIADTAVWLWQNVLIPLGKFLADVFVKAWEGLTIAAEWLWNNVLVPLGDFMLWFKDNVLVPIGSVLADILGVAFQTVSDIAKSFWENVLVPLGAFFAETFGPAVEALSAIFTFLWEKVLEPFGKYLGDVLKKIFGDLTEVIVFLLDKVLKPLVTYVGGKLSETFDTVFKAIGDIIGGMKTTFIGLLTFITGVFTGDWNKAWEGIKGTFSGIFESIKGIINGAIGLINNLINAINKIPLVDIPNIPEVSTTSGGGTSWKPKAARGGIVKPKLARGGMVNSATDFGNFIAGEAGTEMIVPLENTSFVQAVASALGAAVSNAMPANNGDGGDVILQVDGTTFARLLNAYSAKEGTRIGGSMITVT